ncbi:MAG: hypothetical protein K0U78_15255 [Actinomycetia bacterium]|nr:hypothetical protein [Actinomycetes bacterium]
MKKILIDSMLSIAQDEKVAKAVVGTGAATATGTILDWLPAVVGIIASVTTIIFTSFLLYFHWKKSKREEELHRLLMQKERKRRSTDPDVNLDNVEIKIKE